MEPGQRVNFGVAPSNSTSSQKFVSDPLPKRTRGSCASRTRRFAGSRAPRTTFEGVESKALSMIEDERRTRTQSFSLSILAPAAR